MEQRQLGKNGPMVSVIGFGAWPIGGGMGSVDEQTAIATVRAAIDHGITFLDTAQAYYTSEESIGKALKDGYRERCFLATKVSGNYSRKGIIEAIESSLRKLDVEYVDLYQIHGWNPKYPVEESMATMAELQRQGKTRYIGVSNFNKDQMQRALQTAWFQSNQPRYNMLDREIEAEDLPFAKETGIGILAHSPLAKGLLTGRYTSGHRFPSDDERSRSPRFQGETFARYLAVAERLKEEIAGPRGVTLVQLAIAWTLSDPGVTVCLVGSKNPEQVVEHVGAQGWRLSKEEVTKIDEILRDVA
jgi:aryl-alcohol dehydrogenase-like predicted oxidoreductase